MIFSMDNNNPFQFQQQFLKSSNLQLFSYSKKEGNK